MVKSSRKPSPKKAVTKPKTKKNVQFKKGTKKSPAKQEMRQALVPQDDEIIPVKEPDSLVQESVVLSELPEPEEIFSSQYSGFLKRKKNMERVIDDPPEKESEVANARPDNVSEGDHRNQYPIELDDAFKWMLKQDEPVVKKPGGVFMNAISFQDYIDKKKRKKNPNPKKRPEVEKQFVSKEAQYWPERPQNREFEEEKKLMMEKLKQPKLKERIDDAKDWFKLWTDEKDKDPEDKKQMLEWNFAENNYGEHLLKLCQKETAAGFFNAKWLFELIYSDPNENDLQAQLSKGNHDGLYVSGLSRIRKFLVNLPQRRSCPECAWTCWDNTRSKHEGLCWLSKGSPQHQDFIRFHNKYICQICLRTFNSTVKMATHLASHNNNDLFFFGMHKRILLHWIKEDPNYTKVQQEQKWPETQIGFKYGWLTKGNTGNLVMAPPKPKMQVRANSEPLLQRKDAYSQSEHSEKLSQPSMSQYSARMSNVRKDAWDQLLEKKPGKDERGDLVCNSTACDLFMGYHDGHLVLRYNYKFLECIRNGFKALRAGVFAIITLQSQFLIDWKITRIVQYDFGYEIHTDAKIKPCVRALTPTGFQFGYEDPLGGTQTHLIQEAFSTQKRLYKIQHETTDLWRPCFWIRYTGIGNIENWLFTGLHTINRFDPFTYPKRRRMNFNPDFSCEGWTYERILFDQCKTVYALWLIMAANLNVTALGPLHDTTGCSSISIENIDDKLDNLLRSYAAAGQASRLDKWLQNQACLMTLVKQRKKSNIDYLDWYSKMLIPLVSAIEDQQVQDRVKYADALREVSSSIGKKRKAPASNVCEVISERQAHWKNLFDPQRPRFQDRWHAVLCEWIVNERFSQDPTQPVLRKLTKQEQEVIKKELAKRKSATTVALRRN